ncbi:MAG TPA: ArsA-related P-loop ATPase [Solirubrobacteraceae bacterium]|jgi:anion-transporting  ArsA/GET3 family ATPase
MDSLLDRKLIVVTGKGGAGKTTIAAALGLLGARRGLRTVVVDAIGDGRRLRQLLAQANPAVLPIDADQALLEWIQALAGRVPARLLTSRSSFQYFAAAAPGAKELVCMLKVASLLGGGQGREIFESEGEHDLVVLDAPATGHALAMLDSPRTFASIARVGPIAGHADAVRRLLRDTAQTGYLAVALASEMAVTETLELQRELRSRLEVELHAVIVNATLQRRFSTGELQQVSELAANGKAQAGGLDSSLLAAAVAATRTAHVRSRLQHNQLARLRRHHLPVLPVPFAFQPDLDRDALERIADRLDGQI